MIASQRRDAAQSGLLAELTDKLKAAKEPAGSRHFDHTLIAYGGNLRTVHYLDNCPARLAPAVAPASNSGSILCWRKTRRFATSGGLCSGELGANPSAMETARAWSRSSLPEPGGAPCKPASVCAPPPFVIGARG